MYNKYGFNELLGTQTQKIMYSFEPVSLILVTSCPITLAPINTDNVYLKTYSEMRLQSVLDCPVSYPLLTAGKLLFNEGFELCTLEPVIHTIEQEKFQNPLF